MGVSSQVMAVWTRGRDVSGDPEQQKDIGDIAADNVAIGHIRLVGEAAL